MRRPKPPRSITSQLAWVCVIMTALAVGLLLAATGRTHVGLLVVGASALLTLAFVAVRPTRDDHRATPPRRRRPTQLEVLIDSLQPEGVPEAKRRGPSAWTDRIQRLKRGGLSAECVDAPVEETRDEDDDGEVAQRRWSTSRRLRRNAETARDPEATPG